MVGMTVCIIIKVKPFIMQLEPTCDQDIVALSEVN